MELRAEELSVRFEGRLALEGVTLSFPPGARALIVGNAGSGKTTLLKALAGLWPPSSGRVRWNGEDVWRLSREQRRARQAAFGMVFQTDALFDSMTVLDNVLLPLARRRVPPAEARARAEEALSRVGLLGAASSKPEHLSGGMKKRAGIARAIVARPEVLLVDDPLAGLDPDTAERVSGLLLEVAEGRTLLVCAPEPPPFLPLSRWILLREGKVAHDGAPLPDEAGAGGWA